ncbi:MAG: carbon-nitrogen hydrolase family protein [Armatimonadetes bacterium]|nr:carbon-nitrogen hydrolase family protein [Armatimonadota bacterium]
MPCPCLLLLLGILVLMAAAAPSAAELVRNPRLTAPDGEALPADWSLWQPPWEGARCTVTPTPEGLKVTAPRRPFAAGGVQQTVSGIVAGQAYAVEAGCVLSKIAFPLQAVTVRVDWLANEQLVHPAGMLAQGPFVSGRQAAFRDVMVAPAAADAARVTLEVRWPQGGSVTWKRMSLRPTTPPSARKVKVGTVYLRPSNSTPEQNLDLWCEQIDAAGRLGLDIVCLGEAILMVGTDKGAVDTSEPIPGPSTQRLGEAARRNRLYVVAGLMERSGSDLYNTAVLLDREGKLAGTYRKVHLPREEWRSGVRPGEEYPVFLTDFGTIAIQICYDWFFPEVAGIFTRKGAEIIFAPTWGTTFPDKDGMAEGETVFRVRARDNGVYMVPSVYDGSSLVIDPLGRILASNAGQTGVFWAEVDLNAREPLEWVGHWRSIGPRDRMPSTYGE